jgi:two-component system sensor histidine kinase ChvG
VTVDRPPERRVRRRRFSLLTRRILFLNLLAPALLAAGLLYLDDYRRNLIAGDLNALAGQGQIFAAALGTAAIEGFADASDEGEAVQSEPQPEHLSADLAQQILRRLVEATHARGRLFSVDGDLLADTQVLGAAGTAVEIAPLPPPGPPPDALTAAFNQVYDFVTNWLPVRDDLPPDHDRVNATLNDFPEADAARRGEIGRAVRARPYQGVDSAGLLRPKMTLSVAVPVQRFKRVLGVLILSTDSTAIETNLRSVRLEVLKVFGAALAVTVLISIYLGRTITRPLRRLALAAERVRRGGQVVGAGIRARNALSGGPPVIPDLSSRGDEIGDLSLALGDMTEALWRRLDAIERFAADVAHEIKNPLTSLKSAVETAARLQDPDRQRKLLAIILDDVGRLDRLIGDISDASRLDAELSREETQPVDLVALLGTLVDLHGAAADERGLRLVFECTDPRPFVVAGLEHRLGQVFRNLITNAISFTPKGGVIRLMAARRDGFAEVTVEDDGPGMPDDKFEKIFERFYSERPAGEKFGTHSGLGLSISRQIVTAHGGTIRAENRHRSGGQVVGARFVVRLPIE